MLDQIIVLGLVPGTHIQITFGFWLTAFLGLTLIYLFLKTYRKKILQRWVIISTIIFMSHRRELRFELL